MGVSSPAHSNRLASSTSPYLLQHAHNPVEWYPWGPEALEAAKSSDRPILLSIGYSSCHWCHVMERESFEDEATAAIMNEHFVSIKVDREERPDLDSIYMEAVLAFTNGQGGWPMTVFLTPQQHPFYGGTYFPPVDAYGRPGFPTLLRRIAKLWASDRAALLEQGEQVVTALRQSAEHAHSAALDETVLERAVQQLTTSFDSQHGGFGGAPKFPPTAALGLLLAYWERSGDAMALRMARRTLDTMAAGGIHDHIAGGFCRYSVDARWLVPHFEKMLYDNGLLARSYLEGFQATGEAAYLQVAQRTLDYLLAEMQDPAGGFYSATDADSEGEEGGFYLWTVSEVQELLPTVESEAVLAAYDITPGGNFEGRSIPNVAKPLPEVAAALGIPPALLTERLSHARTTMLSARRRRTQPALDDKVITAWNGLVISALAEGARVAGSDRYLRAAERAADFLLATHRTPQGRLLRTSRKGRAHLDGCLEDHAYLGAGLLDLYEAGGRLSDLQHATTLATQIVTRFGDTGGAFFDTGVGHEELIVRRREGHDGATPAPNAVAAHLLARLSFLLDRKDLREAARGALEHWGEQVSRAPRAFCRSLLANELLRAGPVEVVLVGAPHDARTQALAACLGRTYLPLRAIAWVRGDEAVEALPALARARGLVDGAPAAYVCVNQACKRPVSTADELTTELATVRAQRTRG